MKTIKSILLVVFVAMVSMAQGQRVFKVTDVIDGKTILQYAQKFDADALIQTKTLYSPGVTQTAFVNEIQNSFPPEAGSFKQLFIPYFKYIYSLHQKGMTEGQVAGSTTGIEFAGLNTELYAFEVTNHGVLVNTETFMGKWGRAIRDFVRRTTETVYIIY